MLFAIVQGTRPEIIKNYSIAKALAEAGMPHVVLHTNQHHEVSMCDSIYESMGYQCHHRLPVPYRLGTAIDWLQRTFRDLGVTHVIVNGDTAASLAGALAAMYSDLEVSHVEAGLRSHDTHMLEERNRIMVDSVAHHLFAYTQVELDTLRVTPGIRGAIHLVGNTTVDLLHDFQPRFAARARGGRYIYVTLHRKEFTDDRERMEEVFRTLAEVASSGCDVVFPLHPRTRDAMKRQGLWQVLGGRVEIVPPVGIFESLALQRDAAAVITDSGCVQEEAYLLGTPCVTVRENTERHLTVEHGANIIVGFSRETIRQGVTWALETTHGKWPDIYGTPGTGGRIVAILQGASADRTAYRNYG